MEVKEATNISSDEKAGVPSTDDTQAAIVDPIKESETDGHTNGTSVTIEEKSPETRAMENPRSPEKDTNADDRPTKRVREGQKWNDRSRYKYDNKHDRTQYKKNIKSDLTSQKESSDPDAIRKQVEFYFSDSNLLQDKFLFTKVEGHENLPVPISVIHSFKRMRHFQPLSAIIEALKASLTLDVVDDDTCIQRKEPLPEGLVGKPMVEIQKVHEDKSMARSIYVKGFGDEEPSTQFDVEAFFAKYGPTNSVRLRRTDYSKFKGSVFVEFDSEATQKSFLDLNPLPKWHDKELQIKSKKQYCDDKVDDIRAGKVRPNEQDDRSMHQYKSNPKRRRDSPDYDRGGGDDEKDGRDWRVRREEDRKFGYKDRSGGKYRGFGSSGRGRGARHDRGTRERNNDRDVRDERGVPAIRTATPDSSDEIKPQIGTPAETPKKDQAIPPKSTDDVSADTVEKTTAMGPPQSALATVEKPTPSNEGSKKRTREEDDVPDGQGNAKKVDVKLGEP